MYDMTKFKKRYFNMKLKNGQIIDIEPPKMKILKKIANLSEVKNNDEYEQWLTDIKDKIAETNIARNGHLRSDFSGIKFNRSGSISVQ